MTDRARTPKGSGATYQWIRSNILGLVAIFIALSGSAVAAQVASDPGAQTSAKKKKKVKRGPPGPAGPQGPTGPATGAAGGDLTGFFPSPTIASDAVGGSEIQNPTRSVSLPLASFVDISSGTLDFASGADLVPDFAFRPTAGDALAIEFDDTGGSEDLAMLHSTFVIPPDYASGGSFAIRAAKSGNGGNEEGFVVGVAVDGGTFGGGVLTSIPSSGTAVYTATPVPNPAYAAGSSVNVGLSVNTVAVTIDDAVWVYGVEFRYQAEQ